MIDIGQTGGFAYFPIFSPTRWGEGKAEIRKGKKEKKRKRRTRRALLLPLLPADARNVVYVRFALQVWQAVVVGEVLRVDVAAVFVAVQVEIGWFAVDVHESLSFGEEGCCESREG